MREKAHTITLPEYTQTKCFPASNFNGKAPRKGNRTPINQDKYSEEGDWESGFHYYGARYYWSEVLTGWLSVDPMCEKYPSLSPYNYCAENPVTMIDPDGEKIVIKDGDKSYYYVNGHVYAQDRTSLVNFDKALGKEASKIKMNLDKIYNNKSGNKVVSRLIESKQTYMIAADANYGDGSYSSSTNKVSLAGGELNTLEALSHELFHAYQDDYGRTPKTIYNEVEAYVFSGMMSNKRTAGISSDKNAKYNEHGKNILKGFDGKSFKYLVEKFRRHSMANFKDTYKNYGFNPGRYTVQQSLLKEL